MKNETSNGVNKYHVIIIAILVVGAIAIFGGDSNVEKEVKQVNNVNKSSSEIVTKYRDEFMAGCVGEDASYEVCNCALNVMSDRLGYDKLIDESVDYAVNGYMSDLLEAEMSNAIIKCI